MVDNAKDVCVKEAKAALATAKSDAKADKKVSEARQEKNLIYYHCGNIQILNPAGLLEVACICYPLIQAQEHAASAQTLI